MATEIEERKRELQTETYEVPATDEKAAPGSRRQAPGPAKTGPALVEPGAWSLEPGAAFPAVPWFANYDTGGFFDEMFEAPRRGEVACRPRPQYARLAEALARF